MKLADILREKPEYGANASSIPFQEGITPQYIRITDITDLGTLSSSNKVGIDPLLAKGYELKNRDLLIARTGNTVGKSLVFNEKMGESAFAGYLIRFRIDDSKYNVDFLGHYLQSRIYKKWIKQTLKPGAQPNINSQQYLSLPIPDISLERQLYLNGLLDTWNEAVQLEENQISLLEIELSALINQNTKPNNLVNLEEICDFIRDGSHGSHKDVSDGIPLLSAKDIVDGQILIPSNCRRVSQDDFDKIHKKYKIEVGDVLLTIVGTIGRVSVVKEYADSFTLQRSVCIIRLKENIDISFYKHIFSSRYFQNELLKRVNQSAQPGIYLGKLAMIPVPKPNKTLQEKLGKYFDILERNINLRKDKVKNLKIQKLGVIELALSGGKND